MTAAKPNNWTPTGRPWRKVDDSAYTYQTMDFEKEITARHWGEPLHLPVKAAVITVTADDSALSAALHRLQVMNEIRWLESRPGRELLESLKCFDHHRVEIDGEPAVLMTYLNMDRPELGLLAVVHPAADRHPEVPRWVKDAMQRMVWEPTLPPK